MMRALMLYCFLLSSMTTHAVDWERQLWQSKLNTSAGKILQCDTLQLAKQYNQTPVSGHFVSARVTDSVFRDYMRRTHKEDSLNHLKELKELHAKVDKNAARARRLNLPPVVFEEFQQHSRVYVYDMRDVKRFRIKIAEVLKPSDSMKRGDTITVIYCLYANGTLQQV